MMFRKICLLLAVGSASVCSLQAAPKKAPDPMIAENVSFAAQQVRRLVDSTDRFRRIPSPRSFKNGRIVYTSLDDWTSGFFPGSLWYLYELTGDTAWLRSALKYTEGMERIKFYRGNHDIGFMIFCSFGNGFRLTEKQTYKGVIVTAANTLLERSRPGAGVIQSWNSTARWSCPVIIDNMMNLELLFEATRMSGDSTYWKVAVSHADQTIRNQFRPDYSTCHVVDYDPQTGAVRGKYTHQGYADESAWARGQAWGLYGYTMSYRYTRDPRYLHQARQMARFMFAHPNLPADKVPYWDYDDKAIPNVPRDASAAAISASALYELSTYVKGGDRQHYLTLANQIVASLASPAYRAPLGANGNFVLMHSVGSKPHDSEVDQPLVYADYYFLEALQRKQRLEQGLPLELGSGRALNQ